jgi:hypothetical protein
MPRLQVSAFTTPPATGTWGKVLGVQQAIYKRAAPVWDKVSYALNFEFLHLGRWPSLILFSLIVIGLAVAVGCSAKAVKNGVTLGVEFGGGYQIL